MDKNELRNEFLAAGWSLSTLGLAERTGFRCEYCGKDFLRNADDYYSLQVEHIVPRGRREDNPESPENLTVACSTCNFLKRNWDPRTETGGNATRDELIAAAREHVMEWRKKKEEKVTRERELARQLLDPVA